MTQMTPELGSPLSRNIYKKYFIDLPSHYINVAMLGIMNRWFNKDDRDWGVI